jgi:hypothetical protein
MMDTRQTARRSWQPRHPGTLLAAIKTMHTLLWFSIESCMVYLLYAGLAKRSDRCAALAAAVVGGESLIAGGEPLPLSSHLAGRLPRRRKRLGHRCLPAGLARPPSPGHPRTAARPGGLAPWKEPLAAGEAENRRRFLPGLSCPQRDESRRGEQQAQPTNLHDTSRNCRPT